MRPLGYLVLGLFSVLILIGGTFFWSSQFSGFLLGAADNANETEVAQAGLATIQRMVGNSTVWSLAIAHEYNQLSLSKTSVPVAGRYGTNFVDASAR